MTAKGQLEKQRIERGQKASELENRKKSVLVIRETPGFNVSETSSPKTSLSGRGFERFSDLRHPGGVEVNVSRGG